VCGPAWVGAIFRAIRLDDFRELAACILALIAAIFLHEAGHFLAALSLRFHILGASLGPLRISWLHGQWGLQFSTRTLLSGSVSAVPRRRSPWRKHMLIVVAAGPLATLLTGSAAVLALPHYPAASLSGGFLGSFAQLSFFLFTLGLIPSGARARVRNDAGLFHSILRRMPDAQNILLYHAVMQIRIEGFRPRYYSEEVIQAIAAAQCGPEMSLLFAQTISSWALDRGDLESAHAWNRRAAELCTLCDVRFRNQALAESACLDIVIREDRSGAGIKLADVNFNTLSPLWFTHRAKAALALAEGNISGTMAEICRAEYYLPNRMPCYDHQRMLLARMRQIAKALSEREIPLRRTAAHAI
jgi:hypothetical protein